MGGLDSPIADLIATPINRQREESHLVGDDDECSRRQLPFSLTKKRNIASIANSFVEVNNSDMDTVKASFSYRTGSCTRENMQAVISYQR